MLLIVNIDMTRNLRSRPRLGISACLLGEKVRFDGGHKRDSFLNDLLGKFVDWVPVCPELEAGMGVPREPVRLIAHGAQVGMIAERSGRDWTSTMNELATRRSAELKKLDLSGYVFKKNSPSCGMERVKIFNSKGAPVRRGQGLFAAAVMRELPLIPCEEEGRLCDFTLRENFIERVFAYRRWQDLRDEKKSIARLIEFHTRHKLLLLAHSETHYRRLGRIVAAAKRTAPESAYDEYGAAFMQALALRATAKKNANVLDHMLGYFSRQLTDGERRELVNLIADYRHELMPLIAPITLIRHYVNKFHVDYLMHQVYLEPNPKELMLRNHV